MNPNLAPSLQPFLRRRYAAGGPLLTWVLCQPAGGVIAYVGARMGARPAGVTLLGLITGVVGCAVLAVADHGAIFAVAAATLVASYLFDCADGQLARATGTASERGAWLDILCDGAIVVALALAVAHRSDSLAILGAATLLGAGRMASLITGALARRDHDREEWTSTGLTRVGRRAYLAVIDTPVVYLVVVVAAALGSPLGFVAGGLGTAALVQALVVGRHTYAPETTAEPRSTA